MSTSAASLAPFEKICDQPRVYLMDGFASVQELEPLLEIVRNPAELTRRGFALHRNKAGLSFEWEVATEPLLKVLTERTYARLGFDNDLGLTLRFRNYQVGEYHPGHLDAYQADNLYLVATAILYLNDTAQ